LVGQLYHELYTVDKAIPPNTTMRLDLTRNSDDLFLQKFHNAKEPVNAKKFKVRIKDIKCYIPVSTLSDTVSKGK